MDKYQISYDKYLTSEPFSRLDNYIENIIEYFSEDFYNANEDWFESDIFIKWCDKFAHPEMTRHSSKELSLNEEARIIERAHKFYKL